VYRLKRGSQVSIKLLNEKLVTQYSLVKSLSSQLAIEEKKLTDLKNEFMAELEVIGTLSYKSKSATISVVTTEVPTISDWSSFEAFVIENHSLDLLQRRVHAAAWRSRQEDGVDVPGVEIYNRRSIRIALED